MSGLQVGGFVTFDTLQWRRLFAHGEPTSDPTNKLGDIKSDDVILVIALGNHYFATCLTRFGITYIRKEYIFHVPDDSATPRAEELE
jgi:hypothetical protein